MIIEKTATNRGLSLVIPSNHPDKCLIELLRIVMSGTYLPDEILIVRSGAMRKIDDSSFQKFSVSPNLNEFVSENKVSIRVCDVAFAFPGEARNIGVENALGDVIAFLDVKTIPNETWLERSIEILKNSNVDGVWGSRLYKSNTFLGEIIRDAIYGNKPVKSVAGSVIRKDVFAVTGKMISWVPAGEDGDWINRVEAHKLSFISCGDPNHNYWGLDNKPLSFFVKKWWRYYHYSRLLPVNDRDRWAAYGLFYIVVLFFAFNWNYKISDVLLGSPLVVPHITTGLAIAGPVIYAFVRGIYLPLRRKTPFLWVFPVRFVLILSIAIILDLVKIFALLTPVMKKNFN
jgi:glycosyltransferase involved in cell wall biosynthesis